MNWAWASSLDQLWGSSSFPVWLTLAVAGLFGLIALITLLRAEKSIANVALTVITLLSIGVAAATTRGFGTGGQEASLERPAAPATSAALPALACVDDLAGDMVLAACEKVLFASADSIAAAVSYAASRITRLTSFGDVATANRNLTPELESLRRAVERDRYGLMAYVLVARDQCTASACPAFRSLVNSRRIASNMDERVYEGLVVRYSGSWNAPPAGPAALPGTVAALPPGVPTGKPTNAEFPSASSTPAVSIMNPEPTTPARGAPPATRPAAAAPPSAAPAAAPTPAAPKKQPASKAARAPTQLAPPSSSPPSSSPSSPPPPQAPAAENE